MWHYFNREKSDAVVARVSIGSSYSAVLGLGVRWEVNREREKKTLKSKMLFCEHWGSEEIVRF